LLIVDSILPRWRTMPVSASSRAMSGSPKRAMRSASNSAKPRRNRQPAQAGLKAFEAELFEQAPVVADRKAPFVVVVVLVGRAGPAPEAAQRAVVGLEESLASGHGCHSRRRGDSVL